MKRKGTVVQIDEFTFFLEQGANTVEVMVDDEEIDQFTFQYGETKFLHKACEEYLSEQ